MWVAKCRCSCNSMCSCVLGCMLACCFVLSSFEGSGWLMSATCVPWYMPRGDTSLSKHGDPVFPHFFLPLEPECQDKGGRGAAIEGLGPRLLGGMNPTPLLSSDDEDGGA